MFDSIAGYIASRKYSQCFTCCTFYHVTALLKMVELNSSKFYTNTPYWRSEQRIVPVMDWVSGCVFSHVPPLGRLINSPVGDLDYHPVVFQASVFSHSSPIRLLQIRHTHHLQCLLLTWTLTSLEIRFAGCAFGSHHSPACPPAATIPDCCTSQVGPPAHLQSFSTLT